MGTRLTLLIAASLALVHLVLALVYSAETPYRTPGIVVSQGNARVPDIGTPDERQHANYVQDLMSGRGFPVFKPSTPAAGEHYEDHQPPLYYVLAAGWGKLAGVSDVDAPEGVRLRWLNGLIGASSVLVVYFLVLWGLERNELAVGAAAFAALLPMNCALSGAISNDPLLCALCTWTVAVCALALRRGWSWKRVIAAGMLTGLALLTKTTAVALLPVLLAAVVLPQAQRPGIAKAAAALAVLLVIATPWWVRNQQLYGDPLAMGAFNAAFTGSPPPAAVELPEMMKRDPEIRNKIEEYHRDHPELQGMELIRQADASLGSPSVKSPDYWINWVSWWSGRSFIGTFGYMDIWLNETGTPSSKTPNTLYRVLLAVLILLTLAWLTTLWRAEWRPERSVMWLCIIFAVVVKLLFFRFNMQFFQAQGRYLLPAIGPTCLGLACGCAVLLRDRAKIGLGAVTAILLAVNVYALTILPGEFAKRTEAVAQRVVPLP